MSIIDQILRSLEGEIDFYYDEFSLYVLIIYFASVIIFTGILWIRSRINLRDLDDPGPGGKSLQRMLLGLTLLPTGVFVGYVYRVLTNNTASLFPSTKNFLFPVALGLLGVVQLTIYAREVINLSELANQIYRLVYILIVLISIVLLFLMALNVLELISENYVRFLFIFVGLSYAISVIMISVFSGIDYFRTSNKLTRVRLGLTTIAGILILMQAIFIAIYSYALQSGQLQLLIPISTITIYGLVVPTALTMYWSYLIPEKIQIWTGILPPSFLELKRG